MENGTTKSEGPRDNHPSAQCLSWSSFITERRAVMALFGLFLVMAVLICCLPYDPETDLADAVTNDIWVEYYSQGIFSIPYSEWSYGITQSVVVWHDGQYTVVNEKGPGHALMLVPFYLAHADFLFGPLLVALATLSTYMLGKRLLNWRVGAIAAALVLTDVSVVMMWYRYYWTDASTMSLLVLSIWLAVESNYWINGKSLEPGRSLSSSRRQKGMAISLGVLAGLSFGLSISTRYATALILVPILLYLVIFYAIRAWPSLRRRDVKAAIRSSLRMWPLLVVFAIGLLCVLVPLTAYNTEYFGGPFLSGYDGTTLQQFSQLGNTTVRDTSTEWISSSTDSLSTVFSNFVTILPVLIARMPFLVLLPIGVWIIRRAYPLVALLITWVAINFYTYLSISWVSMYASMPAQILYEPRYFIPAIPALALLAGVAIARISRSAAQWSVGRKRANRGDRQPFAVTLALLLTVALVLCSLVPAMAFFSAPGQAGGNGPPQGQPDGPGGLPNGGRQTGDGPPPGSEGVVGNASGSLSTLSLSNIFS